MLKKERAAALIDIMLSLICVILVTLVVVTHQKLFSVLSAGEELFAIKKERYAFGAQEIQTNCSKKSYRGIFFKKSCCKEDDVCSVFIIKKS